MSAEIHLCEILKGIRSNSIYVEVGVLRATALVAVSDNLPQFTKLYGIDFYEPYLDKTGSQVYKMLSNHVELNKQIAQDKIKESKYPEKIQLVIKESKQARNDFEEESVDVVFLDAYMSTEDTEEHINTWKSAVKKGGILCGHDWNVDKIQKGVINCLGKDSVKVVGNEVWYLQK